MITYLLIFYSVIRLSKMKHELENEVIIVRLRLRLVLITLILVERKELCSCGTAINVIFSVG
jgi:hypothetical protein